jgi:hypothetical protein
MCTMATLGSEKQWPLLTSGRCSEVIYVIKVQMGPKNVGRY